MEGFKVLLAMCFLMSTGSVQGISNSGNEFNLMFPPNLAEASAEFPPILYVTTDEDGPVQFTVSYSKSRPPVSDMSTHIARKKNLTRIELPFQLVTSFTAFCTDCGITLKAEEGKNIIVYTLNEGGASTDVYLGLPYFETKNKTYCYYGVSVPRSSLEPKTTYGYMAIVVQEAGTVITLTPTVQIEGFLSGAGLRFQPGRSYSSNPLAKGFTVLLRATEDLTGSKISSNKPITFITGHQCGFLPSNVTACDHLTEQLPPAETFGFKFVLVPLLLREQDVYKIVASRDGTMVNLNCVNRSGSSVQEDSFSLDEGQCRLLFIHSDRFCKLEAYLPILVVQIALGHSFDKVIPADPFMVMIPPLGQYRNDYTLIFAESFSINSRDEPVVFKPRISLSVPSECCNRGQIEFDDGTIPWNIFVDVKGENGEICACAAQYEVPSAQSRGGHCLQHSISECTVGVIVYAYEKENSYGYPGGMNVDSIAVPNYCFKDEEAIGSEPSGVLRFTLENTGTPEAACITFTTSDGTANAGTDFVVENNTCCFGAGQREAVCEIKINQDSDAEEEDFTVIIVPEDGQCVCNKSLTGKIIDDPVVVVEFNQTRYSVCEDDGFAYITVVSDIPAPVNFTVQVSFTDGTATASEDYNSTTKEATFANGTSSATVQVPIIDDNQFEHDEVFQAAISVPGDITGAKVTKGTKDEARVTIWDKGNTIKFEKEAYTAEESVGHFKEVRLVADQPFAEDASVPISFEDISANGCPNISVPGIDYGNSTVVVTFKAGERFSSYASIPIISDDDDDEGDEQFNATFELPGGYRNLTKGEPEEAVITIKDVVTEICVEFNQTRYDVSEGDGFALLTLVSSTPIDTEYTVEVLTKDGTATAGDDYLIGVAPFSATFASGESSATILIPIRNDSCLEDLESFFCGLSIPGPAASLGVKAGVRDNATVYIDDNDSVEVVFDPISYIVSESDGNVTLTLRANSTASCNYTVQVNTSDGSATGGEDYTSGGYEVTFPAGSSTAQLTIDITDDNIAEPTETFTARLSVSQSVSDLGVSVGSDDTATVNIEDDDVVTVDFTPFEYTVSESDGDVKLILVADKEASFDYTVEVTTADSTATAGSDYTGIVRGTATFRAGETTATVQVPILEDDDLEGLESFVANLSIPDSAGSLGVRAGPWDSATVTIEDNDGVVVVFDPIAYNVSEGDGEVTLTLRASSTASFDYTVRVDTSDGSATGGDDYISGGYEVTFPAGSSTAQFTIDITDDNIPEPTENFTIRLSVSQSVSDQGVSVGSDDTATVNIEDNDVEPPVFAFEDGSYEVNEAAGTVRIGVVKQSGNIVSGESVTIDVTPRQGSEPIRGEVPATEGDDYTSTTRQVVFQSSDSIQYVEIPITDDGVFEGTEYFYADLAISAGSGSVGAPNTTIVFITEAGPAGPVNVNFAPTIYNVSEEDECAKLTLMSDSPVSMNYTVKVITQDRRAMSGSDYEGGEYDAVFVAGETTATVCIPIIDDNDFGEGTENFVAFINATESSDDKRVQIGEDDEATVNIRDNDEIFIDFDPVTYNFSEGAGFAILTVKASAPSSTPYTVMVDTQDGSAVDTGDYAAGPYPVEFPSGVTEVQIMIPLLDDNTDECDENFFGNLRIPMQAANMGVKLGSADRATVTIKDDDKFQVNFVSTEMEVFEEQTRVRVCLEHNRACMEEFTVQVGNRPHSNRSASSPDDYRNGPYEVFFPEGEKMACIDIPVIDDGVEEGPERFQLQIMPPDNGGVPFEPGSKPMAQITINDGNIDGDPMFTVPLSINKKMLSQFSKKDKQWDLCYEVHGREDKIYNLVSDQCVFVNTHLKLASNPKVGNIMARIGIIAKDYDGRCHKIQADLEGKKVTINDMQMKNRNWLGRGISVIKLGDKVRVSVPNCKGHKMVFWITFHFMNGADMIKFIIADGTGLSPSSHGLMGQFWNTPVEIKAMKSEQADTGRSYRVIIYSPFTGPRQFTGDYYPITWDYGKTPCLYAGTKDGSPVIEGKFTEYEVKELFDPHFSYSQFKRKQCSE